MAGPWEKYGSAPATGPWSAYASQPAPEAISVGEDVAKSLGSGVVKGAAETAMLPVTLPQIGKFAANSISDFVFDKGRELFGLAKKDRSARDEFEKTTITGMLSKPQAQVREALDETLHKPQTTAGEYAETIGEFAPAAATGGGSFLGRVGKGVIAPAVASESAGQLTEGTALEPWARFVGAVTGGVGANLARAPGTGANNFVGGAARGVTDQQFADARRLVEDAAQRGITLTADEAINAVTNGGTKLADVRRYVEGSEGGGNRLAPVMAQRPEQVMTTTRQALDQVSPPVTDPSLQGARLQEGAEGVLTQARQAINQVAQPHYDALRGQAVQLPPAITNSPAYQQALARVRGNEIKNQPIANLPDDNAAVVNEVVKELDTMGTQAAGTEMVPGDRRLAALIGDARQSTDTAATAASPDYRMARDIVRTGNEQILDPLRAGPVGTMSRSGDVGEQIGSFMPKSPLPGSDAEVSQAFQGLMRTAPDPARSVVRQGLERELNTASTDSLGRPDQFSGARFANAVRGNPQRGANIGAALEATAGAPTRESIERLVDILAATGWRPRPGSATAFNQEMRERLGGVNVGDLIPSATDPFRPVRDAIGRARLGNQTERIADLLLSGPEGVDAIRDFAARSGSSPTRDALVRALLTSGSTAQPLLPAPR
jgi:hypothetical protein